MIDRRAAVAEAYTRERWRRGLPTDYHGIGKGPADAFIAWCDERGIDPVQFVAAVGPELDRLPPLRHLGSDRTERIYEASVFDDGMTSIGIKPKQPEIWIVQERLKQRYQATPRICVQRVQFTGGFTPRSEHCRRCSEQERCRAIRLRRRFSKSAA